MTEWLLRLFVRNYDQVDNPAVRTAYGSLAGWVGIASNGLLVVAKLAVGFLSSSVAIIADGLNNLSDAASSIISLLGFKIAAREADREHPFGHGRYEYLSGLVVAALVLVIGIELGKIALRKPAADAGTLEFEFCCTDRAVLLRPDGGFNRQRRIFDGTTSHQRDT